MGKEGRGKKGWKDRRKERKERASIEGKKNSFSKAIESISATWYGAISLSTSNAISDISISFDCLYCFHAFISHLITYSFRQTCVKAINFTLLTETKKQRFPLNEVQTVGDWGRTAVKMITCITTDFEMTTFATYFFKLEQ